MDADQGRMDLSASLTLQRLVLRRRSIRSWRSIGRLVFASRSFIIQQRVLPSWYICVNFAFCKMVFLKQHGANTSRFQQEACPFQGTVLIWELYILSWTCCNASLMIPWDYRVAYHCSYDPGKDEHSFIIWNQRMGEYFQRDVRMSKEKKVEIAWRFRAIETLFSMSVAIKTSRTKGDLRPQILDIEA